MSDKVYPSAKPATNGTTNGTAGTANPAFPATKAQLYGATRPAYRPQPKRKRSPRRLCCACCLWTTVILLTLILLAAIFGAVLYAIYRPHRPSFAVSGLKISALNFTTSSTLTTNINVNITTKNPNKHLVYTYNPLSVSVTTQKEGILIGNGLLPSFVHGAKNTTLLKASITSNGQELDDAFSGTLKTDLKSKNGVGLLVELDTKAKAKMGGWLKSPKVGIRVSCDGIKATVPTGKTATSASVSNAKCKVEMRIKIWKWTF